jgi:Domain of unknown function (DUF1794).
MAFVIPEGLAPEVYPLAWLLGRWRGEGVLAYPGIETTAFRQDVVFDHDGGPYLSYSATIRLLVAPDSPEQLEGELPDGPVWATESGFWRVPPERPADLPADRHPVEALLADPSGHLSLYVGAIGNGRIDLASDLVVRTASAAEVKAATRLYGYVEGDLMWAWDLAAFGNPLQSYASARLSRVEGPR